MIRPAAHRFGAGERRACASRRPRLRGDGPGRQVPRAGASHRILGRQPRRGRGGTRLTFCACVSRQRSGVTAMKSGPTRRVYSNGKDRSAETERPRSRSRTGRRWSRLLPRARCPRPKREPRNDRSPRGVALVLLRFSPKSAPVGVYCGPAWRQPPCRARAMGVRSDDCARGSLETRSSEVSRRGEP